MRAAGRGRIVTITSVGGRISAFGVGLYCASKFAQEGLAEALWQEVGHFGIKAVIVEPGIIKTERWGDAPRRGHRARAIRRARTTGCSARARRRPTASSSGRGRSRPTSPRSCTRRMTAREPEAALRRRPSRRRRDQAAALPAGAALRARLLRRLPEADRQAGASRARRRERLLFTCWPYDGHVVGPLAHRGRGPRAGARGRDLHGRAARAGVEREGFEYFPFRRLDEERADRNMVALETREQGRGPGALQLLRTFRDWLVETIPDQVADIQPIVEEWRPDVVMSDLSMWGPVVILWEADADPGRRLPDADGPADPRPATLLRGGSAWRRRGPVASERPSGRSRARPSSSAAAFASASTASGPTTACRRRGATFNALHAPGCRSTSSAAYAELDYSRRDLPPTVHYVGPCISASARPIRRRPRGSSASRPTARGSTPPRPRSTTATRSSSARRPRDSPVRPSRRS